MASENFDKLKKLTEELVDRDFFLKRKQEMLEKLLLSTPTPVVIWVADKNLKFITNAGTLPNIGSIDSYESVYEYFGTTDPTFFPINYILQTFEDKEVTYLFEHKERRLWTKCSPLKDYSDKVIGAIGVTWDFTRIHDAIELLENLLAEDKVSKKIYSKIIDMRNALVHVIDTKQTSTSNE
jgi:hypothetical protein